MKCSKYQSEQHVKNGIVRSVQRYKCKECGCNFSIDYSQVTEKAAFAAFVCLPPLIPPQGGNCSRP